jgi:putative transposase
MAAVCYVSLNPVGAGLVGRAADWEWSSVRVHLAGEADDRLVTVRPALGLAPCFADLLLENRDQAYAALRRAGGTASGRRCGVRHRA